MKVERTSLPSSATSSTKAPGRWLAAIMGPSGLDQFASIAPPLIFGRDLREKSSTKFSIGVHRIINMREVLYSVTWSGQQGCHTLPKFMHAAGLTATNLQSARRTQLKLSWLPLEIRGINDMFAFVS